MIHKTIKNNTIVIIIAFFYLILFSMFSLFYFLHYPNNLLNDNKELNHYSEGKIANGYSPELIVYFENASFSKSVINKFEFYGGEVNQIWNNSFNSICGFSGIMNSEMNKTLFEQNFSEIYIEPDLLVESQMNFALIQTGIFNTSWDMKGFTGLNNASVAVLDTGINKHHPFLYEKVIEQQNLNNNQTLGDENGHGTFIASIISSSGSNEYSLNNPNKLTINKNYSHSELFDYSINPGNYSIKLATINISNPDSYLFINSTWSSITLGIDEYWIQIFYDGDMVKNLDLKNESSYYQLNYSIPEDEVGLYDIFIKYHKELDQNPIFASKSDIFFVPESYYDDQSDFVGISNRTQLVDYKVLNKSGKGRVSNVISGFAETIKNHNKLNIISVCLSLGGLGEKQLALDHIISEVCEMGIFVVIAAGNYGIKTYDTLSCLASNKNAIIVGAINDNDQITSYSSRGGSGNNHIKPDIVAPGGSKILQHRSIIGANYGTNHTTSSYGTSISTAIVSAAIHNLIGAKWNNASQWKKGNATEWVKIIKSLLLMTATETNQARENDPDTEINEALNRFSPPIYMELINTTHRAGLKDIHEGYGRINLDAALDALLKKILFNKSYSDYLISSEENSIGPHAFARQITLIENHQYLFNLTEIENDLNCHIYLFSNRSNNYGEPILLESSRKSYGNFNYLYFTPEENETGAILVIKAINGEGNFTLEINEVENLFDPYLKIPEISINNIVRNTTVLSLSEIQNDNPQKNITLDEYQFYIEYFDNDSTNVPPQKVYLYIPELSRNYTMSQQVIEDNNYTDGVKFESEFIKFPSNDTYSYQFFARDGLKEVNFPLSDTFELQIEIPEIIKNLPYNHQFNEGLDYWKFFGTGWNILTQINEIDNRSVIFENEWNSIYFGTYHNKPKNYTYQPKVADEILNGSLISPVFDLTNLETNFEPMVKMGIRVSINIYDSINLLISVNGSAWEDLLTFSNQESDWYIEQINLTDYMDNYIRLKFLAELDEEPDLVNYKGFIVDFINIDNYTNDYSPSYIYNPNEDIIYDNHDLRFQEIQFKINVFDLDNNYPEYVYLEINQKNYSMINYYGEWNVSSKNSDKGIIYYKSISLDSIKNQSYRFHIFDGLHFNSSGLFNTNNMFFSFSVPEMLEFNVYQNSLPIGYQFEDNLENFYIVGKPEVKENTAWLRGDNNWHVIRRLYKNYLYCGLAQGFSESFRGYGQDWNATLISKPVKIISLKDIYLEYAYEIDLQNELSLTQENRDSCNVSISRDYGETWINLKTYYFNSEGLPKGNESIKITDQVGSTILLKFELNSNNYAGSSPGFGWLLSNIYLGYDRTKDHIAPSITILNPKDGENVNSIIHIKVNISDNNELDFNKLELSIDGNVYYGEQLNFDNNTGLINFSWDTLKFSDGWHTIKILAYDIQGNKAEKSILLKVDNLIIRFSGWIPWLIIGIIGVITISILYKLAKSKMLSIKKLENIRRSESPKAKKERLEFIKKIEESKEEFENYPLTLHCKYCDSWFYSNDFDIICPKCERDQIFASYKCLNCGKWHFKDEPREDYYCDRCNGVKLVKRKKEDIAQILRENKQKVLLEFKNKKTNILE